jgi:hypothetical protein
MLPDGEGKVLEVQMQRTMHPGGFGAGLTSQAKPTTNTK